ncbi:MAG: lipoyl domain-containing protein [Thermoguttaceae bacterium]
MTRFELFLPELEIDDQPILVSLWLVRRGSRVTRGEQVLELLAGAATVDLAAPTDGVLSAVHVEEGDTLSVGQRLATFQTC